VKKIEKKTIFCNFPHKKEFLLQLAVKEYIDYYKMRVKHATSM